MQVRPGMQVLYVVQFNHHHNFHNRMTCKTA